MVLSGNVITTRSTFKGGRLERSFSLYAYSTYYEIYVQYWADNDIYDYHIIKLFIRKRTGIQKI